MKRLLNAVLFIIMVLVFSVPGHADLYNRGTDSLGNRLIYDSDLNITWYDYTKSMDTWYNQMTWASTLSVSGGNLLGVYDDWRLPSTVDGLYSYGYDGTTTAGYNITSSEMGHLYYSELRNNGWYDTSGNTTGCSSYPIWCLTNTSDFTNLQRGGYWSGTEYSANPGNAWNFYTQYGQQDFNDKSGDLGNFGFYAIAVHPGDVSVAIVPEPTCFILFITGGILLTGRRYIKRKNKA